MLAFAALLRAQTFASHFEDITVDRRPPLDLSTGLAVEPASGALDVSIPLGPGIGEGGVRFVPTLRGHLAPQISWVRTSAPSNRLEASSQATFSLQPGSMDLKLTSHFDTDARAAVSGFELWNGITGTFHLDQPLPDFEDPIDADRLIQAFGYDRETVGKAPHPRDESAGRMVKYATDGSLVLALGGRTLLTPITSGVGDQVRKGTVESPARVLLIRQGIAYEFTTSYDSRFEGKFGNIWFSRFRLTGIRNKFGDHIRIEYSGNGLSGPANQMGYEAEYVRGGWATGQKVSMTVGAGGDSRVPIRIAYAAPEGPTPVFDLDAQVEYLDLVPEGVSLWERQEVPEWCDLSRRLLVHEASNTRADQWIRFSYDSPSFTYAGVSLTHRLLGKVAWSNGRALTLQWKDYPYRRNDARPGKWQGYFSQYFDSPGGREQDKRSWTYGISAWIDTDTVTASERKIQYARTVPIPRWGSRHSWDDQRFHTAIILPDGQVRLEKYARPVQGLDGGLDTTPAYQIRTLAHLRHMVEQVRLYARGVDWQADVDRPAADSTAYRVETHGFNLGQEGYPGRRIDEGAYPRAYARQTLNRDNGFLDTGMEGQWDAQACAPGQDFRVIQRGQTRLYAEETRRSFAPLPRLGMLTRPGKEVRTVTLDAPACVSSQSILPQTWETGRILDDAEGGILDRPLGTLDTGPGGPTLETRSTYKADAGPEARLVSRMDLSSRDLSGAAGASYAYDELGRLMAIQPKGVGWRVKQALDGLGRPASRTDANGRVTGYRWDDAGRLTLVKPPEDEEETFISYHADGRGKSITRGVQRSHLRFNAFGDLIRETKTAEGGMVHRRWGYDPAGRTTWATVWLPGEGLDEGWQGSGLGPRTTYRYDERGRIIQEMDPNEEATTTAYGPNTRKVTKAGESTVYWFDHLDRLVRVTNALGESTAYGYDPAGRMTVAAQEDAGTGARQWRTWAYNGPGWLTAADQPETGLVQFGAFTVLGKPQTTAFKGDGTGPAKVLQSTFDSIGRLVARASTDGTVDQTFAYDVQDAGGRSASTFGQANGKPTYARDGNVETFRSYSGAGGSLSGLDTQVWPGGKVDSGKPQVFPQTFKQDELGHRIFASAGQGKVATGYDRARGIATSASRNDTLVAKGTLDDAGNLVVLDFANGVQGTFRFEPDQHRLKALGYAKGSALLAGWNLAYDARGVLRSNGEDRFEHDGLARLTKVSACRLGGDGRPDPRQMVSQSFAYDAFGNRISSLATGALPGESTSLNNFAFDLGERKALSARNRIPSKAGGLDTGAGHDAQGNLTAIWRQAGAARTAMTLTYDALGRVIEVWDGAKETRERYGYSPEGLRTLIEHWQGSTLSKRLLHLHDDAARLVSQYEAAPKGDFTWKRDLVHMGGRMVAEADSAGIHMLQADPQGSIRLVTGAEGKVEAVQKYLPFGEPLDGVGARPSSAGFAGHEQQDASGLICMRRRFYLPMLGRFASPDPGFDQRPDDPRSWHLFAYAQSSPIMLADPTGMGAVPGYLGGDGAWVDKALVALYQLMVEANPGFQMIAQATDVASSSINALGNKELPMLSNLGRAAQQGAGPGRLLISHSMEVPTSIMAGETGGVILGHVGRWIPWNRAKASTVLYRAVDSGELASIQLAGGKLLPSPGGGLGKYFAYSQEGAAAEAKALGRISGNYYSTIRVKFPSASIWPSEMFHDATPSGMVRSVTIDNAQLGMAKNVEILSTNSIPK